MLRSQHVGIINDGISVVTYGHTKLHEFIFTGSKFIARVETETHAQTYTQV